MADLNAATVTETVTDTVLPELTVDKPVDTGVDGAEGNEGDEDALLLAKYRELGGLDDDGNVIEPQGKKGDENGKGDDKGAGKDDKPRNEKGQYTSAEDASKGAVEGQEGTGKEQVKAPPVAVVPAPDWWEKEEAAKFAEAPPEIQRRIAEDARQVRESFGRMKADLDFYDPVGEVLQNEREYFEGLDQHPAKTIGNIVAWVKSAEADPLSFVQTFARQNGIDLSLLVPNDPQRVQLDRDGVPIDPDLVQLRREMAEERQRSQMRERQLLAIEQRNQARREQEARQASERWARAESEQAARTAVDTVAKRLPDFDKHAAAILAELPKIQRENPGLSADARLMMTYNAVMASAKASEQAVRGTVDSVAKTLADFDKHSDAVLKAIPDLRKSHPGLSNDAVLIMAYNKAVAEQRQASVQAKNVVTMRAKAAMDVNVRGEPGSAPELDEDAAMRAAYRRLQAAG